MAAGGFSTSISFEENEWTLKTSSHKPHGLPFRVPCATREIIIIIAEHWTLEHSIDHNNICGLWKRRPKCNWLNVQHQMFAAIFSRKQFERYNNRWLHWQQLTMTDMTVGRLTRNKAFHINFSNAKTSCRRKYWTMARFTSFSHLQKNFYDWKRHGWMP